MDRTTGPDGKRANTARMYLDPIRNRPNLTVVTGALAQCVRLDGRRARGVAYQQNGQRWEALASREVILSGGAVNSPQLLMLSGIGPADALREHGIATAHELPGIGANLQDHPDTAVIQACKQPVSLHDTLSWFGKVKVGLRWSLRGGRLRSQSHRHRASRPAAGDDPVRIER